MDSRDSEKQFETNERVVLFRNSEGLEARGTLIRLSYHRIVFEVYHFQSVLRLSEVVSHLRLIVGERTIYSGGGVICNLVSTGTSLVAEATLSDSWIDGDTNALGVTSEKVPSDYGAFIHRWQKLYRILPDFKIVVTDLQSFLMDLRGWLDQVELGIRSLPEEGRAEAEMKLLSELSPSTTRAIGHLFGQFEEVAQRVEDDLRPAHQAFSRRHLHPLVLCAPFINRIFTKPLGYAGDYEMVSMIVRDPFEGNTLFAKLLNAYLWSQAPAEAHRNRVKYLTQKLFEETVRVVQYGRRIRILNLGCGPAKEVQDFLQIHSISDSADLTLLDMNDETVAYARQQVEEARRKNGRLASVNVIKKSVQQVLKQAGKHQSPSEDYDFIYCAGLFDYLNDRLCATLLSLFYDWLGPGGLLLVTNVDVANPIRHIMDYILEWHLIYRTGVQLESLSPEQAPSGSRTVIADPTSTNIFLEIRKPHPSYLEQS